MRKARFFDTGISGPEGFVVLSSGETRDLYLSTGPEKASQWSIRQLEMEPIAVSWERARPSGGVVYFGDMPSLTEILEEQRVAYSVGGRLSQ